MIVPVPSVSRRGRVWAWVPALLLGSMLLGLGLLAYIAMDDPHFALEPNYYDKAVHWDRSQTEARASEELGLELELTRALVLAADGSLEVEVKITDRARAALTTAVVELEAFPNAYAARIEHVTLEESAPGIYRARLAGRTPGLWELRFRVAKLGLRFQHRLRSDVAKVGAA